MCVCVCVCVCVLQLIYVMMLYSCLGVFNEDHGSIASFWKVISSFSEDEKNKLLKFVTSCSRPPLLGFKVSVVPYVSR